MKSAERNNLAGGLCLVSRVTLNHKRDASIRAKTSAVVVLRYGFAGICGENPKFAEDYS